MEREYIAFISYKHTEVDTAAAMQIQHLIEHYTIPKNMQKQGKKHLGMVFRDTDELNVSSDLSDALCTALDHSEYLLVLCSPQYKESEWCRREIVYFLKNHDIGHVLPILVNGIPSEAFPEELFRRTIVDGEEVVTEPLAANIASDTIRGMKQNLNREYLRIISQMLDCKYDELVQRKKRYERRRRILGFGTAFTVLFAFIIMLLVKNAQINARYQESQRNQARYLSRISLEQYAQGDRKAALESALAVLPDGDDPGPVVPEQMYALSNAVNAYQSAYVPSNLMELPDGFYHVFSDNRKYMFCYDSDYLRVYDVEKEEVCYTLKPFDFVREHSELPGISAETDPYISLVVPEGESGCFVVMGSEIVHVDVENPSEISELALGRNNSSCISYASGKMAVGNRGMLAVYDWDSGELIYEKDFNENEEKTHTSYIIQDLKWDDQGTSLAVAFDYINTDLDNQFHNDPELNKKEEAYYRDHDVMGLILVDPVTKEIRTICKDRSRTIYYEEGAIGAEHVQYPSTLIKTSSSMLDVMKNWYAGVYDVKSGECIFKGDMFTGNNTNTFGFCKKTISVENLPTEIYILWIGKTAVVIDAETREILYMETFHTDIVEMTSFRNNMVDLVLYDGSVQHLLIHERDNIRTNVMKLDVIVKDAWVKGETYYILTDKGLISCSSESWNEYTEVTSKNADLADYTIDGFRYFETVKGVFRLVKYKDPNAKSYFSDCHGVEVYPALSGDVLYSYRTDDADTAIKDLYISSDGETITIPELNSDGTLSLSRYRIPDGTEVFRFRLSDDLEGYMKFNMFGLSQDGNLFWIAEGEHFHLFNLSGESPEYSVYSREGFDVTIATMTQSGKYLTATGTDQSDKENMLLTLNLENGELKEWLLPDQDERLSSYSDILLPAKENLLIYYDSNAELCFFDAETNTFLPSMDVYSNSKIAVLES